MSLGTNNRVNLVYDIKNARQTRMSARQSQAYGAGATAMLRRSAMLNKAGNRARDQARGFTTAFERSLEELMGLEGEVKGLMAEIALKMRQLQSKKIEYQRRMQQLRQMQRAATIRQMQSRKLEVAQHAMAARGAVLGTMAQDKKQNALRTMQQISYNVRRNRRQ